MSYEHTSTKTNGSSLRVVRDPIEIERDVATLREEMVGTLRRLERKLSPHDLLSRLTGQTRAFGEGSGEFAKKLGGTVRDHPIPVLLLLSGVTSLLLAERERANQKRKSPSRLLSLEEGSDPSTQEPSSASESMKEKTSELQERAAELSGQVKQRSSALTRDLKQRTQDMKQHASERTQELFEARAQDAKRRMSEAQQRARSAAHALRERGGHALHEQPFIVVGLGLMLGALVGASLPKTQREERIASAVRHAPHRSQETAKHGP